MLALFFSCKRRWTEKDRQEFVSGCLSAAVRDRNIGDSLAKPYCNCLLQKVVSQYPNANDAAYLQYDTSVARLSRQCLAAIK